MFACFIMPAYLPFSKFFHFVSDPLVMIVNGIVDKKKRGTEAAALPRRALELDSTLAAPHATLGYATMYYDWDWPTAEGEYQMAIARNPSYATAHEWFGLFLAAMGRFDEAQAQERQALELDPLSTPIAATAGWVGVAAGAEEGFPLSTAGAA